MNPRCIAAWGNLRTRVNLKLTRFYVNFETMRTVEFLIFTRSENTCCAGGASMPLSYCGWFVPG